MSFREYFEGPIAQKLSEETDSDLYVTSQVFLDNVPLSLPVRPAHKYPDEQMWKWDGSFCSMRVRARARVCLFVSVSVSVSVCDLSPFPLLSCLLAHQHCIPEWLSFPITYRDLPRNAHLLWTVWAARGTCTVRTACLRARCSIALEKEKPVRAKLHTHAQLHTHTHSLSLSQPPPAVRARGLFCAGAVHRETGIARGTNALEGASGRQRHNPDQQNCVRSHQR
jgi:hypothetical protein